VLRPDEVIDRTREVERLRALAASGEFPASPHRAASARPRRFSKLLAGHP
jgi:hypothetical protein